MNFAKPIEIAEDIFWVGSFIPGDKFQSHVYLVRNGSESVLIDPGSEKTLPLVLEKIYSLVNLRDIKYIIMHHQDPDITGCFSTLEKLFPEGERYIITHWRTKTLLEHYNWKTPFLLVDDINWSLELNSRTLEFIFTPYAHFPGAICTFDSKTRTLFSSDIFGAISDKFFFYAQDTEEYYKGVEFFHKHYIPSRAILNYALDQILSKDPELIAPQHGSLIKKDMINKVVERLRNLKCGLYLLEAAQKDSKIERLVRVEEWIKKLFDIVIFASSFKNILHAVYKGLREEFPEIKRIEVLGKCDEEDVIFSVGDEKVQKTSLSIKEDLFYNNRKIGCLVIELEKELNNDKEKLLHLLLNQIKHALAISLKKELDFYILRRKAHKDPLTGLYNKEYLIAFIQDLINRNENFSVAFIDLDKFKNINDTYGHLVGDCVLKEIAKELSKNFRREDCIGRFGGEEFIVVAKNMPGELLCKKIDFIRDKVASLNTCNIRVTFSAGVSEYKHGDTVESILERADNLLYKAKQSGRNKVVCEKELEQ